MTRACTKTAAELARELREMRRHLTDLCGAVRAAIDQLDTIMQDPTPGFDRGRRVSSACNRLEFANDTAMHFGLDMSFDRIRKAKRRRSK